MNNECNLFRKELRIALENTGGDSGLRDLAWHGHLHGCAECRELLAAEEALEALLLSLPHPQLSPGLAARVLARLAKSGAPAASLDALLDLDCPQDPRPGLADRVLAHLAEERSLARRGATSLDELLDTDRDVVAPVGLETRVLKALEPMRTTRTPILRLRWRWVAAAAAALLVALLGMYALNPRTQSVLPESPIPLVARQDQPDPYMLENLQLLEEWELLEGSDLEMMLSTLPAGDEYLLDLESTTSAEGSQPKKG